MGFLGRVLALLRPLDARDEGMAAGTGLMTGRVADTYAGLLSSCPACRSRSVVIHVVDLVERRTDLCCQRCRHYWSVEGVPSESNAR
jgi:hypothetical protein